MIRGRTTWAAVINARSHSRAGISSALASHHSVPSCPSAAQPAQEDDQLMAELLARGAIKKEVDTVVGVHQQLANTSRQGVHCYLLIVVQRMQCHACDIDDYYWQCRYEESEGHCQQHDGETHAVAI